MAGLGAALRPEAMAGVAAVAAIWAGDVKARSEEEWAQLSADAAAAVVDVDALAAERLLLGVLRTHHEIFVRGDEDRWALQFHAAASQDGSDLDCLASVVLLEGDVGECVYAERGRLALARVFWARWPAATALLHVGEGFDYVVVGGSRSSYGAAAVDEDSCAPLSAAQLKRLRHDGYERVGVLLPRLALPTNEPARRAEAAAAARHA